VGRYRVAAGGKLDHWRVRLGITAGAEERRGEYQLEWSRK
jgi:hypothetical protein